MTAAFLLTLLAGLATVIGGLIGVHKFAHKPGRLSVLLSFAAGAMICVALIDLIPVALESLKETFTTEASVAITIMAALAGALLVGSIDKLLPISNSVKLTTGTTDSGLGHRLHIDVLLKSGLTITAIMALHNFPEGIITFTGTMHSMSLGLSVAMAIALHNVPEGIAIASPIFAATKSKSKALRYATIAALAEPVGAVAGYLLLVQAVPTAMLGIIFSATAGMMICVSVSELIPSAKYHATKKSQLYMGTSSGAGVMALSLLMTQMI